MDAIHNSKAIIIQKTVQKGTQFINRHHLHKFPLVVFGTINDSQLRIIFLNCLRTFRINYENSLRSQTLFVSSIMYIFLQFRRLFHV